MGESTLWGTFNDFFMFWVIIMCKNVTKIFLNIDMVEIQKMHNLETQYAVTSKSSPLQCAFHPYGFCARKRKKRRDDIIGSIWGLLGGKKNLEVHVVDDARLKGEASHGTGEGDEVTKER